MTQVTNVRKPDYASALGTAVIGGLGWGTAEYFMNKKSFLDKESVSDSFVKKMETALIEAKDKPTMDVVDFKNKLTKSIDDAKNIDELKAIYENNKSSLKFFGEKDVNPLFKEDAEIVKSNLKGIFTTDGKYKEHFDTTLKSCLDENNKFFHDSKKITKEKFDLIKKTANKFRRNAALKSAASFTAICGACCCLFEYFFSKKKQ